MATSAGTEAAAFYRAREELNPIDVPTAEGILREAKQIMDRLGIGFHLMSGTLLGAIRDNALIPWDDDMDIGSVIGLDGLTADSIEQTAEQVASAFRDNGFFAVVERDDHYLCVGTMKSSTMLSWSCFWVVGDSIFQYPGVRIPVSLYTNLKEIDFVGEKFLVPNPPEEFLRRKYGPEWMTPKKAGYQKDIVQGIPESSIPGHAGRLRQFLTTHVLRSHATRLRVLDHDGRPVAGAEVVVTGLNRSRTNKQGYATFYLPRDYYYAIVIRFGDHEEVLYEETIGPGKTYVYRAEPSSTARWFVLTPE